MRVKRNTETRQMTRDSHPPIGGSLTPIGEYLTQYRHKNKLSIRALAERSGIHHSTLARLEKGEITAPTPELLARLAISLDIPLADAFALARYPSELPSLPTYLHCRYHLCPADISRATELLQTLIGYGDNRRGRERHTKN